MNFQYPCEMRLLPVNYVLDLHDVTCGRGKKSFNHYGNECFRKVIDARLNEYTNAGSKMEKTMIIREVIANIRAKTVEGGFVKFDHIQKRYFEIGKTLAREKTSQAFRDALYGDIKRKSALNLRRTIGGATRKNILKDPVENIDIVTSEYFGCTKQDLFCQKVLEASHDIQEDRHDSHNTLRMGNIPRMATPNTISPSPCSKPSFLVALQNKDNDCDDVYESFSALQQNQSVNQDHTVRQCDWTGNDSISDSRYIILDKPKSNMNYIQTENSCNKKTYDDLFSWFEHSNDQASKSSFHRYNDAFPKSAKHDDECRIHDCYKCQIYDMLFDSRIQNSIVHQEQRSCNIDCNGLIQAFEIGDIDPFEPTPY